MPATVLGGCRLCRSVTFPPLRRLQLAHPGPGPYRPPSAPPRRLDDRHEGLGGEAGAADEGAVDVGDGEQARRIPGRARSAVEDADARPGVAEAFSQRPADGGVHLGGVVGGGGAAGADRPDRFVGDDQLHVAAKLRDGMGELEQDLLDMAAGDALLLDFADAQYGLQARGESGLGLGADDRVALMMVGAALGMADDDQLRARLDEHRSGDVAGMGAARLRVAILGADRQAAGTRHGERDQRKRRADGDVHSGRLPRGGGDGGEFGQSRAAAVHLPVAGDELAADVHGEEPSLGVRGVATRPSPAKRGPAKLAPVPTPFYDPRNQIV